MEKIKSEYIREYGNISRNENTRFTQLLNELKLQPKACETIFKKIDELRSIEWKRFDFNIYLVPKATPRPRHSIITNTFYVTGSRKNKDLFKKFIKNLDVDMIVTPCKFTCLSYLPIPKSMNKVETVLAEMGFIRPISTPDFDNLAKTYSDMMKSMLLYDDALIIDGVSKKFYSTKPRIEIHIEYMDGYDSKYNETKMRKKVIQ